jgi:type I restriction enzyme R subunit
MGAAMLYESPFTDLTPRGPEGLFSPAQVGDLLTAIKRVRRTAMAA